MDLHTSAPVLISQKELATRWGRSQAAISLYSAMGVGPKFVKYNGAVQYTQEEVLRYERACLFFEPAHRARESVTLA